MCVAWILLVRLFRAWNEAKTSQWPKKFVITSYSIHYTKLYEGAAPAIASAARSVNTGQAQQIWASDPADVSPASGRMNIDLVRKEFGVVDTGGGGKVDVTCRLAGQFQIAPGSPESKVGALVLIDAAQSRYEIRLPARNNFV